jgi:DNA-binding IclR family transcriptional regulator
VPDRDGRAFGAVVMAVPSVRCKAGHLDGLAGHLQDCAVAITAEL